VSKGLVKPFLILTILFATSSYLAAQTNVTVTTFAGRAGSRGSVDGVGAAARFQDPESIAVDPTTGNIYVADGQSSIRKITPDGLVTTTSMSGRQLAFDYVGNLYTATSRSAPPYGIDKYSPSGQKIGTLSTGNVNPGGPIAVDKGGNVYFETVFAGDVYKVLPDGTLTSMHLPGGSGIDYVGSIVCDANGVVYITGNGAIWVLTGSGTGERLVNGTSGGLTIDAEGNLYTTYGSSIEKVSLVPYGNGFRPEQVSTLAGVADSTGSQDGRGRMHDSMIRSH
jgi:hypothetical protein